MESLSAQYEFSLKRIAQLEGETKRIQQLETQIRTLQRELKELNHQYNQLLELDGERLEKLEEQAQDIIDLRHLLREQVGLFLFLETSSFSAYRVRRCQDKGRGRQKKSSRILKCPP